VNDRPPDISGLVPIPTYRDQPATPASDLSGVDLTGCPTTIEVSGVDQWTLLVFLSTSCDGCRELWLALEERPSWPEVDDVRPVVVVRDRDAAAVVASGARERVAAQVIVSDRVHSAYRVYGPPFFVLVDGPRSRVATEGVAFGAPQVADEVRRVRAGFGDSGGLRLEQPLER
jgi:hypothetical protein